MTNKSNTKESNLKMHLCKICGQKMFEETCRIHSEKTGHNDFKPLFENNQQLKGGSEK